MKRNLLFFLMLICSMSVFMACSDDDDVDFPIDENIAGNYKGTLSVSLGVGQPNLSAQNVYLSKAGNNAIKMELKDFQFATFNVGDIVVDNCILTEKDGIYYFTGEQTLDLTDKGLDKCKVKIVKGEVNGDKLALAITVNTTVPVELTVSVDFSGSKLEGNESSEAKITSFTFDSEVVMEQPVINESTGKITFKINDSATDEELKLVPVLAISGKAIVYPASGVAQDFSKGKKVVYTVVAEDGTAKEYEVSVAGSQNVMKFSFEEWENIPGSFMANEYDKPKPTNVLATSSEGASMLKLFGISDMPTYKTDDGKEGDYAIKLKTMDTSAKANALVPAITAGSVFTGKFDLDFLNDGKLYCTRFGIAYDKKPLRFKGWYKYTPGTKFIDGTDIDHIVEVPGQIDECAVQAILFQVETDEDVLTGFDVNTSDKRVAVAVLTDGSAKNEYTYFDLPFTFLEGKSYDDNAKYKLAIVCSSSKEGDFFKGAGESTLILDELEIIGE